MSVVKKERIEFIDLAKGVCILLIIMGHCGINVDYPGLTVMRTPLYLTLSGLFFKDYGRFYNFFIKKCNRLLFPFLFFYLASYSVFYLANAFFPGLIVSDAKGVSDVFTQNQYFNGPIWFLLDVFWSNMLFYLIYTNLNKELFRGIAVFLCGLFGVVLYKRDIFLPCFLDCAFFGLPFFYFGYILKKSSIMYPSGYDKYNILIALLLFGTAYIIDINAQPKVYFHDKMIEGNLFSIVALALISVTAILMLCKAIKRIPVISYFGRYSIIPLCIHHLIYRPIMLVVYKFIPAEDGGNYMVALLTILACLAAIPLLKKYIPVFTAQKDLITV